MNYKRYAEDVVSGKILACEYIILACKRFLNDLQRPDLIFNERKVDLLVKLGSVLHHYSGEWANQPFKLTPWQEFLAANIFGFYYKETGRRRFNQSYIECARKQGKTFLVSLFCLFSLILDGEDGGQVLLAASSADQARIAFEMCQILALQLDNKGKDLRVYRNEIFFDKIHAKMKVLAADADRLDGYGASFACIDEFHAHPNSKVRDVIKSSSGARKNAHICTITTAGFNLNGPCYQLRNYCIEVLKGIKEDDSIFAAIYEMDEGDEWTVEENWYKSNPNLDVTVDINWLRSQVNQAKNNPSDEVGVRTKNLNQWISSSNIWIPEHYVKPCLQKVDMLKYNNDDWLCYSGFDLSAVSDLTALSFLFINPSEERYVFKTYYYLPKTALNDKYNSELYKIWVRNGFLTLTDSNTTDYNYIQNQIEYWNDNLNIQSISYDAWNASQLVNNLLNKGLIMKPFSQAIGNFNRPSREFERLILEGKVIIDNNPITRFCLDNVLLKFDHNGNCKPDKSNGEQKIDGVIAMLQCLGQYLIDNGNFYGESFVVDRPNFL